MGNEPEARIMHKIPTFRYPTKPHQNVISSNQKQPVGIRGPELENHPKSMEE